MAVIIDWHGAGIADETTVTNGLAGTGDTAITTVTGTPPVVDTNPAKNPALRYTMQSGQASYITWTFTSHSTFRASFYFQTPSAWPANAAYLITFANGATNDCRFAIGGQFSPGQARIYDITNTAVGGSATGVLSLNTWYRVEFIVNQPSSTVQYLLYNSDSTTAFYDSGTIAGSYGGQSTSIHLGNTSTTPTWSFNIAHLTVTDDIATPIAPHPSAAKPGTVTIFNGTSEVAATAAIWDSTDEITGSITTV